MYLFDKEKEMYIFKGDLKEYLLCHGVENEHINKMQRKILESDRSVYQEFSNSKTQERYITLVPLDKVIGTSRADIGLSVYENVRTMHSGNREPGRFEGCFSFFDELPLLELRKSYEELINPVEMVYFVDDDRYFVLSGNHRTLVAMLVGAEFIRAKVTNGHCNILNKKKYCYSEEFKYKYNVVRVMSSGNKYDISFKDDNGVYEILGYSGPTKDEDFFSYINRLSCTIDSDTKKANHIKKMPSLIQKVIMNNENNSRINQYIQRKYLSEDEMVFWGYRTPVTLYLL